MEKNQRKAIEELKNKDFSRWMKTRHLVFERLSSEQSMFCLCGKLATGLHESSCKKFNDTVDRETYKKINEEEMNRVIGMIKKI